MSSIKADNMQTEENLKTEKMQKEEREMANSQSFSLSQQEHFSSFLKDGSKIAMLKE